MTGVISTHSIMVDAILVHIARKTRRCLWPVSKAKRPQQPSSMADRESAVVERHQRAVGEAKRAVAGTSKLLAQHKRTLRQRPTRQRTATHLVEAARAALDVVDATEPGRGDDPGRGEAPKRQRIDALIHAAESKRARCIRDTQRANEAVLAELERIETDVLAPLRARVEHVANEVESHGEALLSQLHAALMKLNACGMGVDPATAPGGGAAYETRLYVYGREAIDPSRQPDDSPFL